MTTAAPGPAAVILALTTEASQQRAEALAEQLLSRGLVACVSLQPVHSLYHWQGQLERSQEVQVLCKTTAAGLAALETAVRALHSYDTPEWLVWSATPSAAYGAWVAAAVVASASTLNPDAGLAGP